MARITPLSGELMLLESPYGAAFTEHARATLPRILAAIERDPRGTLHGLGSLVLSKSASRGKRVVARTAQQELRDGFEIPLRVIAEPREWHAMRRAPTIVERNLVHGRVLVQFTAVGIFGGFGGTCLYALRDGMWACYRIRPSASASIAEAERWMTKRGWEEWR